MLANIFKYEELPAEKKRSAYGKLCGLVGILLNLLLFVGKFVAGLLSHSIAITADAFNNLSDAGSSRVHPSSPGNRCNRKLRLPADLFLLTDGQCPL